jgi:hypothetical protein
VLGPFEVIKRPLTIGTAAIAGEGGPAKSGPLIWWKLDETQGATVKNAAGQKLGGAVYGSPRWAPGQGQNGGALEFDGERNWVEAVGSEDLDFQGGLTLATWFKVRKFNGSGDTLFAKGDSLRLQRHGSKGALEFTLRGPMIKKPGTSSGGQQVNFTTKREVDDGEWHHAAVTYDGNRVVLYLDGTEEASAEASGHVSANNLPVSLGENCSSPGRWFNGWMNDTRVYSRGLTAEEIKELSRKL